MKETIEPANRFKKDCKAIQKQQIFDQEIFNTVVRYLGGDIPLEEKHHDHALHGDFEGERECHIKPDWLLINAKDAEGLKLILMRTGSHSKLFGLQMNDCGSLTKGASGKNRSEQAGSENKMR